MCDRCAAALAPNVVVWGRGWLETRAPQVRRMGMKRLVRDVFGVAGAVEIAGSGHVTRTLLNQANRLAHRLLPAFQLLLATEHVSVRWGET